MRNKQSLAISYSIKAMNYLINTSDEGISRLYIYVYTYVFIMNCFEINEISRIQREDIIGLYIYKMFSEKSLQEKMQ